MSAAGRAGSLRTTRRGFLHLAGASVAFAGLANLRALPVAADAATDGRFFSAADGQRFSRIAERMVASDDLRAPAWGETRALDAVDALCARLDPELTAPLPTLLRLVEWSPFLFELRLARFSSLDEAGRDAHLAGWMRSRFRWRRQAFLALRNLALLGYYSQEQTWAAIGYRGPLLGGAGSAA